MYSESFMKYLIEYRQDNSIKNNNNSIKEIEFKPVKVREAAKVVIASIKEYL